MVTQKQLRDIPSTVGTGIIGWTTEGEPVFEPPAKTTAELAKRIERAGTGATARRQLTVRQRELLEREQARQRALEEQKRLEEERERKEAKAQVQAQERAKELQEQRKVKKTLRERFVEAPGIRIITRFEEKKLAKRKPRVVKPKEPLEKRVPLPLQFLFPTTPAGIKFEEIARRVTVEPIEKMGGRVEPFVPEGRVKEFLFTPVGFRVTDIIKFAAFAPLMPSGQGALARAIKTGQITPVAETKFVAAVRKGGKITEAGVIAETQVGGAKVATITRQISKKGVQPGTFISRGRGLQQVGEKGVTTKFEFLGAGRQLGKVTRVKPVKSIKISVGVGKGVEAKAISQQISVTKPVLKFPSPKIRFQTKELRGIAFPTGKIVAPKPTVTTVTGVTQPLSLEKQLFRFAGTTDKPITALTKTGFVRRFPVEDISVKGLIKLTEAPPKVFVRGVTPRVITKTPLKQTFADIQPAIGTIQKEATKAVIKTIKTPKISPTVSAAPLVAITKAVQPKVKVVTIQDQMAISKFPSQVQERFGDLGILRGRFGTGAAARERQLAKQKMRLKAIQKPKQKGLEKIVLRERVGLKEKQAQRQILLLQQRVGLKQRGKVPLPIIAIPQPRVTPTPLVPLVPFKARAFPKKKPKGLWEVEVRRRGVFKPVGVGLTLPKAMTLGKGIVGRTLAATFRLTGKGIEGVGLPKGFRRGRKAREGLTFVELPSQRLSMPTEVLEIHRAKRRRRKRK